jgi:hypothetical protein
MAGNKRSRISVSFDGENFFWIIVENGKIINRNPTKEGLMGTKLMSYNKTNVCPICIEEKERYGVELTDKSILYPRNAKRERDKNGKETRRWVCQRHRVAYYQRYDPNSTNNIIKQIGDRRTGNLDPNSSCAKGDNSLELACELYGWVDINKKNDNYTTGTPIDCYDPNTGLYHQVQGRHYSIEYGRWPFGNFERELEKKYGDMVCFCISEDGKIIERIYIFPKKEVGNRADVLIIKNPLQSRGPFWYEQYRRTDENELKKANEIWRKIIKRNSMRQ